MALRLSIPWTLHQLCKFKFGVGGVDRSTGGFTLFKLLSECFKFFHFFTGERELRARIKDLMRYRKNGITKLAGNYMLRKVISAIHVKPATVALFVGTCER